MTMNFWRDKWVLANSYGWKNSLKNAILYAYEGEWVIFDKKKEPQIYTPQNPIYDDRGRRDLISGKDLFAF